MFRNAQDLTTAEVEGEVGYPFNRFKPPVIFYITDRSKAVLLIWFYVFACFQCFGVSFCTFSSSVCLDDI